MNVARLSAALPTPRSFAFLALILGSASLCSAGTLTYSWAGNNGFSGYFSLDNTAFGSSSIFEPIFGGAQEYQFISNSYLDTFYMTDGSTTFDLANIVLTSGIWFNSAFSPPAYADGAGYSAIDALGDELSFNGRGLSIIPANGGRSIVSEGNFIGTITNPEPGTIGQLMAGLLLMAYFLKRRAGQG